MKTRLASILAAVAALVATTAVANVTTNVFTNVTYKSQISYSLVPVTNSVMRPVLERAGLTYLTVTNADEVYVQRAPTDTNKLDTTKTYMWASFVAYTNVSGTLGIVSNIGKCYYAYGVWYNEENQSTITTGVAYTNMNDVAVVSGQTQFQDTWFNLTDDASHVQTVWGTNGLHTVTNIAKRIVYKPDFEVTQMLVPSIVQIADTNVYTNVFINGINVTR